MADAPTTTRRHYPATVVAAAAVVLSLVAAACSSSSEPKAAPRSDQPQVLTTTSTRDFAAAPEGRGLVFETLLGNDGQGNTVARLAESWEVSADQKTYTFTLRDGVLFHDGTPLTADVAKFGIEFNAQTAGFGTVLDRVEVVDPRTLRIHLTSPYWNLLGDLGVELSGKIIGPSATRPPGDLKGVLDSYIGTGPWKLESYVKDGEAVLTANEAYWGGAPKLDKVIWKTVPDSYTQVLALRAGELDLAGASEHHSALPYSEVAKFTRDPDFVVEFHSYGRYQVLDFNTLRAPTDNVLVRRAFNHAVNREAMAVTLFEGLTKPAVLLSPPVPAWEWGPQPSVKGFGYDPDLAKSLLDQAGWKLKEGSTFRSNGTTNLTVELLVPYGEANSDVVSLFVQSELRKVGVEVQVTTLESGAASKRRNEGGYHMFVHHTCSIATTGCLSPKGKYTSKYGQLGVYSSPELDANMIQAFAGADDADRRAGFDKVWTVLHDQAVSIPLYDIVKPVVFRKGVEGWTFGPTIFDMELQNMTVGSAP